MNLKNWILSYFIKKRKDEIDWFCNNPLQSQEDIFIDLIPTEVQEYLITLPIIKNFYDRMIKNHQ